MSNLAWTVNSPDAVSEVIDGELVVMNLASGHYFSGEGVGALLWAGFEQSLSREALIDRVVAAYEVDAAQAAADLDHLVQTLIGHGLLRVCTPAESAAPPAPTATRQPYQPPELKQYTDMKDLLLLDPIHDVAEEGWPMRPADREAA